PPLRELAKLIEAVRRQASGGGRRAPLPAPATTAAAEHRHATPSTGAERIASLSAALAEQAAEIDRLRARLAEAEAGAAHEQRAREELESTLERGLAAGQADLRKTREAARRAEATRAALAAENARLAAELERARGEAGR